MRPFVVSQDSLLQALKEMDGRLTPEVGLILGKVGLVRYHTRLEPGTPVHVTRESTEYAAALFETEDPERHRLAAEILKRVLPIQDRNPESPSCGVWPWFYEEPLEKMSPPDWNWADFIGAPLSEILLRNTNRVEPDLLVEIKEALRLAAWSIMKRDVRLSYTNIAIMGTYVTIMAGTLLNDAEILTYGRNRLRRFVQFTRSYGGFPEYNSPTYAVICLIELSRMMRDFTDAEDLHLAREIHDRVWEEIAVHWHGPSKQWSGPHSRSYGTMLMPGTLAYLQGGLKGRVQLTEELLPMHLTLILLPIHCPDAFVSYFSDPEPRRRNSMNISEERPVFEGMMYMEPEYVLSSAQRAVFWNQARGLVAYAPSERGPVGMALRFLHDGYDFSSGNLLTRQKDNHVLAGMCLAYDRGDKHPELDRFPDRKIRAEDWRLRLEFFNQSVDFLGGKWAYGESRILPFGSKAWLGLKFLFAEFDRTVPVFEIGSDAEKSWLDLVFYQGPRREFHLAPDFTACAGLALVVDANRSQVEKVATTKAVQSGDSWTLTREVPEMQLAVPRFPSLEAEIVAFARARNLKG